MFNPIINPFGTASNPVPVLREAFPDWKIGNGIFDALDEVGTMPWHEAADSEFLDLDYFGNHSGAKFVAPIVMHLIDRESLELLDADRVVLAKIIWTKFAEPWSRLWQTNIVAYNPIHNYNMTDTRDLSSGDSSSEVDKRKSVDSTDHGRTNENWDYTYGLNSTSSVGKITDRTLSQDGGKTEESVDEDGAKSRVAAKHEVEVTQRSGNIGVTTSQAMLQSERELWMWNYFAQIYKDIDSVLALAVYDTCRI